MKKKKKKEEKKKERKKEKKEKKKMSHNAEILLYTRPITITISRSIYFPITTSCSQLVPKTNKQTNKQTKNLIMEVPWFMKYLRQVY